MKRVGHYYNAVNNLIQSEKLNAETLILVLWSFAVVLFRFFTSEVDVAAEHLHLSSVGSVAPSDNTRSDTEPKSTHHAHLRHEIERNVRLLVHLSLHTVEQLVDDDTGWSALCVFIVLDVNCLYVTKVKRSNRGFGMASNTGQSSLSLRDLIAPVQQNVIAVLQDNGALIPQRVREEGVRIANTLPFVIERFPLVPQIGSDVRFVIRQAQVEMTVRLRIGGYRSAVIAEL